MSDVGNPYPSLLYPKMPTPLKTQESRLKARYTTREDWLSQNECKLSDLWEAMRNYLNDTNSFFLDKCDYVTFCDFVATNSTQFDDGTN